MEEEEEGREEYEEEEEREDNIFIRLCDEQLLIFSPGSVC